MPLSKAETYRRSTNIIKLCLHWSIVWPRQKFDGLCKTVAGQIQDRFLVRYRRDRTESTASTSPLNGTASSLIFLEFFETAYKIRATTVYPRLGIPIIDLPSLDLTWGQFERFGYQADATTSNSIDPRYLEA